MGDSLAQTCTQTQTCTLKLVDQINATTVLGRSVSYIYISFLWSAGAPYCLLGHNVQRELAQAGSSQGYAPNWDPVDISLGTGDVYTCGLPLNLEVDITTGELIDLPLSCCTFIHETQNRKGKCMISLALS